jgi:hypothetical protein
MLIFNIAYEIIKNILKNINLIFFYIKINLKTKTTRNSHRK